MRGRWVPADQWCAAAERTMEARELAARRRRLLAAQLHQRAQQPRPRPARPVRPQPFRTREQAEAAARLVEQVGMSEAARRLGVARSSVRLALKRHGLSPLPARLGRS